MIHVDDDKNIIQILECVPIEGVIERPDAFTLRTDCKHVWLQKACLWVMKKLCANYLEPVVRCKTVPIDRCKVVDAIFKLRSSMDLAFREDASAVFMGHEEYCEILNISCGQWPTPPFVFDAEYSVATKEKDPFDRFFRGHLSRKLKVYVIPWMKGVLVV